MQKDLLTNIGSGKRLKRRELRNEGTDPIRLEGPSPRVRVVISSDKSSDKLYTDSRLLEGATLANADVFFDPTSLSSAEGQPGSL